MDANVVDCSASPDIALRKYITSGLRANKSVGSFPSSIMPDRTACIANPAGTVALIDARPSTESAIRHDADDDDAEEDNAEADMSSTKSITALFGMLQYRNGCALSTTLLLCFRTWVLVDPQPNTHTDIYRHTVMRVESTCQMCSVVYI
jgi:hypothetical protein